MYCPAFSVESVEFPYFAFKSRKKNARNSWLGQGTSTNVVFRDKTVKLEIGGQIKLFFNFVSCRIESCVWLKGLAAAKQ